MQELGHTSDPYVYICVYRRPFFMLHHALGKTKIDRHNETGEQVQSYSSKGEVQIKGRREISRLA